MKTIVAATAGLLALAASPARAQSDTEYSITETFVAEWMWDNENGRDDDDYYWDIKSRTNVSIREPGLDAGLRIDLNTFRFAMPEWMGSGTEEERAAREAAWYARHGAEADEDGEYPNVGDYRLERAYAVLDIAPDWRLNAGDFYAQVGRGIVLSFRKVDEMGIDNAIRGARIDGMIADRVEVMFMGGITNVANVDERFNLIAEDPMDTIAAGEVTVGLWGGNRASAHVVFMNGRALEESALAYGGALDFPDLPLDLSFYGEVDAIRRTLEGGDSADGIAAYGTLAGTFGPVNVRAEYKYYDDFVFVGTGTDATNVAWEYNRLPFADSEDQLIESPTRTQGGHLRVDVSPIDGLSLFVAAAGAGGLGDDAPYDAVHAYGGVEFFWDDYRSVVRATGGYRRTWLTLRDAAGEEHAEDYREIGQAGLDATLQLWGPLSLTVEFIHEQWTVWDIGTAVESMRGTTALSLDWAGIGGVFGAFEYDTQDQSEGAAHYFGSGGVQWFATDWLTVRGRAGSQRGGEKCVSGVCRDFPEMMGARLELVVRI